MPTLVELYLATPDASMLDSWSALISAGDVTLTVTGVLDAVSPLGAVDQKPRRR